MLNFFIILTYCNIPCYTIGQSRWYNLSLNNFDNIVAVWQTPMLMYCLMMYIVWLCFNRWVHISNIPLYKAVYQCSSTRTLYPKKYAHGFFFAVLCCSYTLTDFPISIRLTSLALWQSNDCPSASKATLMNMDKYFMWIHYERLYNHNKAKHNKTVCIFLGVYCMHHQADDMSIQTYWHYLLYLRNE